MPSTKKESKTGPCIFCEIVAGRAPASMVGENSLCAAFLTLRPIRDGHALVIPKRHAVEYIDASPEELAAMLQLGAQVAQRQRRHLGSQGETLFLASGDAGEQSVFHVHLHVVPRALEDGIDLTSWWGTRIHDRSRAELDSTAAKIRS